MKSYLAADGMARMGGCTINDGDAQNLDITDGIWSIPENEGRICITGSFAETRDVTGIVTKGIYVIYKDNITRGAYSLIEC